MTKLGFTGTREGLTEPQYSSLRRVLSGLLSSPADQFHHGDCIGADATAHDLARSVSHARIWGHPPNKSVIRAYKQCDWLAPERPYLDRNKDIVHATERLVACPDGPERQRSGTWSTIRYARRQGRPVTIVWPDGTITP